MPYDFSGRRIVVTGGATGVGAALLDVLTESGATDVTVLDLKEPEGPHATYLATDLADQAAVDAAVKAIDGPVDVLFNNAGVADTLPPATVFQVNVLAPIRLGEALLPQFTRGGAIVTTASIAGLQWAQNLEVISELLDLDGWDAALAWFTGRELGVDTYSFTKQVMQVWTMRYSKPAAAQGVRVNSVCPAPIDTPLLGAFRETMSDAAIDFSVSQGGGRLVTPREVASCLAWLASPESSFVSGVNLNVDGGLVAALTTGQVTFGGGGLMAITEAVGRGVNVLDPEFYVDPWASYAWLRDEAPAFWDPAQRLWVITRYDDVMAIEKDAARYSSFAGSRPHIDQRADRSMINMDDPAHQAQRNLVSRRFNPGAVRAHEERVRAVVTEILDAIVPAGECEAIEAIASRLPAIVIGDLLGYEPDQWEKVRWWSERIMLLAGQTSPGGPPHVRSPEIAAVIQDFYEISTEIVEARRAEPRDDLISVWAQREGWDNGHVLEEALLVLDGGAETTRTVIGTMIRELALQPEQRRLLVDQPELLATTAVEEFIRWVSPVLNMRRTVTTDHELHGQQLHEGDEVLLMYAAANRDPRVFADPERLDVTRTDNRHVAFGFGTHFCLGAWLARLEIRVMFEEMLRRIPNWELVEPDEPRIMPATFARAYDQIRIRFGQA